MIYEGNVDFSDEMEMTEYAYYWRDIALRYSLKIIYRLKYRKTIDPVRIGLSLLADEGCVPSAEILDLLVCV